MPGAPTQITLAMLHFVQATPAPSSPVRWSLWPDSRRLRYQELCAALEAMSKPALVSAHVEQGGITAFPLAAVAPESRARLEHQWRGQGDFLRGA